MVQSRVDTIPKGHNPEWTPSRIDTIPNEHDPEWALTCKYRYLSIVYVCFVWTFYKDAFNKNQFFV